MCSKILPNKSLPLGQINQQSVNFKPILDGNDAKHEFGLKRGRNGEKGNTGMEVDSKPKPRISERAIRILFGEMENAGVQQFRGSMCNSKNTPHTLTFDYPVALKRPPIYCFLINKWFSGTHIRHAFRLSLPHSNHTSTWLRSTHSLPASAPPPPPL